MSSNLLGDVAFALDAPGSDLWSLKESLKKGLWPPLPVDPEGGIRLSNLVTRLAEAGSELRRLAGATTTAWPLISTAKVVQDIRHRLRDPAVINQQQTGFCGPMVTIHELARRSPADYVLKLRELLITGGLPRFDGSRTDADDDLRELPVPTPPGRPAIAAADWIIAATIRDEENFIMDVETGEGREASTNPGAVEQWTRDLLGLRSELCTSLVTGELEALDFARRATDAGGVAFLEIDGNMLITKQGDHESDVYFSAIHHLPGTAVRGTTTRQHSKDDAFPPDHFVVFLGGLTPSTFGERDRITFVVWSWGSEYTIDGIAEDVGEYLYSVVAGWP